MQMDLARKKGKKVKMKFNNALNNFLKAFFRDNFKLNFCFVQMQISGDKKYIWYDGNLKKWRKTQVDLHVAKIKKYPVSGNECTRRWNVFSVCFLLFTSIPVVFTLSNRQEQNYIMCQGVFGWRFVEFCNESESLMWCPLEFFEM